MPKPSPAPLSWLRLPDLIRRRRSSRSATYRHVSLGLLPPPVHIGPRTSVWPEHEIEAIDRARLAGASDDDVRRLVSDLIAARGAA